MMQLLQQALAPYIELCVVANARGSSQVDVDGNGKQLNNHHRLVVTLKTYHSILFILKRRMWS